METAIILGGLFLLIVGLIGFVVWSNRKDAKSALKLQVEQAGREQREAFDKAGDEWASGGGLAGRMFNGDTDSPPAAKKH